MARIVTFGPNGARIYEGADPKDFKGQTFLVDPVFPRGIPPHLWTLENGQIKGAQVVPQKKQISVYVYTLVGFVIGVALTCLLILK